MKEKVTLQNLNKQFVVTKIEDDPFYELACAQQDLDLMRHSTRSSEYQRHDAEQHVRNLRGPLKGLIRKNFRY